MILDREMSDRYVLPLVKLSDRHMRTAKMAAVNDLVYKGIKPGFLTISNQCLSLNINLGPEETQEAFFFFNK